MYLATVVLQNLVLGTQILMVAMGLYLVSASSRIIHLATGAIGAATAYGLYFGISSGWPLVVSLGFSLCIAFTLGIISAELLEPFAVRREPLLGLLVSFAFGMIIESIIAICFGSGGKSLQSGILPVLRVRGAELDLPGVITILLGGIFAFLAWIVIQFTSIGRILKSISEDSLAGVSLGINTKTVRRITYLIAAGVAGCVITLTGWHTALTPLVGFHLVVAAFIALLMGGVGDIRGTVVSSYLVALIPGLIIGFSEFSENWRLVIVFILAAIILAFRPRGIFSREMREA